ncbi:MAG: class I mannose-6-phosphate isomerase [Myxococcales bacterium]|nr:MAG: class I mannose-6-phosphate isomerase [Myxococcales bacterium]
MWDKVGAKNWRRPLRLTADNFTPPARTPWGGRRIVDELKAGQALSVSGPVGEAWELSVEPDFPSRVEDGPTLDEVLRADPTLLGCEADLGSTALLIKLVDAADDLSLQIHPSDADPMLGPGQSGKPEAWYIIDAEPGAGLYLGFVEGVSRQGVSRAIEEGNALDRLMSFVPVSAGDLFVIEPGTPHAIGKGVLLLEPQRVNPGKRGITYRYWDWNRRYDASGKLDDAGEPRTLHVERALDVTDWEGPRGQALIDRIRYPGGPAPVDDSASLETLMSPTGPLRSESFFLRRLAGSGHIELGVADRLQGLTMVEGRLTLDDGEMTTELERGQTAALPASIGPLGVDLHAAHAMLCTLA